MNSNLSLKWKRYSNNFQEQDFLRDLKFPPFSSLLRRRERMGGIFKFLKKTCSWKLFYYLFPSFIEPERNPIQVLIRPHYPSDVYLDTPVLCYFCFHYRQHPPIVKWASFLCWQALVSLLQLFLDLQGPLKVFRHFLLHIKRIDYWMFDAYCISNFERYS